MNRGRVRNGKDDEFGGGLFSGDGLVHSLAARRIDLGIAFAATLDNTGNDVVRSRPAQGLRLVWFKRGELGCCR